MFFKKKRPVEESFKLELPEFEKIEPIKLDKLPEAKFPKIKPAKIRQPKVKFPKTRFSKIKISKKQKISRKKKQKIPKFDKHLLEVPTFEKPKLKIDVKSKKSGSFLKLKNLEKSTKDNLIDLNRKSNEHGRGVKLILNHIKEHAGEIGEINKDLTTFSRELKSFKTNMITVSTFDNFSRQVRNKLETLNKLDREVSGKLSLIKELKRKIDDKSAFNLKITNQMKERMVELERGNNNDSTIMQENLNKMMIFLKELSDAFNNSVVIREEMKKKLSEHDGKIRELVGAAEKPFDIDEYLRKVEENK